MLQLDGGDRILTLASASACSDAVLPATMSRATFHTPMGIAMCPRLPSHPCRAFSLVEMLVVIAIIVLLISILQPSLAKSRELARRSLCASQTRQQGIGMGAFANDRNHRYPISVPIGNWPDGAMTGDWSDPTKPAGQGVLFDDGYVTDPLVFYCPSNSHSASAWTSIATGWNSTDWRNTYVHYPYWANFSSIYDPGDTLSQLVARGPSDPSDRVLVSDNITLDVGPAHANSVTRNHLGIGSDPAGGNVQHNDNSSVWVPFETTELRVSVPVGAAHQRDFHF